MLSFVYFNFWNKNIHLRLVGKSQKACAIDSIQTPVPGSVRYIKTGYLWLSKRKNVLQKLCVRTSMSRTVLTSWCSSDKCLHTNNYWSSQQAYFLQTGLSFL